MEDDLFTYELEVVEDFYFPGIEQAHDNLTNDDLDVYEPQWLDMKFGDHRKVGKEIIEEVVSTWLIRSYKKKFNEYMEIKKQLENALWLYWIRGDDEEVLTDEERFDLEEEKVSEEKEIAEIFKIETDIFDFKIPLYYKDAWIYEWNREVLWVEEKPWLAHGTWKEPNDDISNMTYFQNYEWYDALEYGDLKDEALKEKAILEGLWGHENREVDQERFDNHKLVEDDDDIMDLNDYLIRQDASYYVDEEERFKEKRKLLRMPYEKPPTFKSEKIEVIKYSLGPKEEYVAIKEYEYDIWLQTEENVSRIYEEIFRKKDEGLSVTRMK
ncbi:hypothetical protein Tco_0880951 [Tanacetum coccineum]